MKAKLTQFPALTYSVRKLLSLVPAAYRLGKPFWQWYGFFEEAENWSEEKIKAWQLEQLKKVLHTIQSAYPYYRNRISPSEIDRLTEPVELNHYFPVQSREEYKLLLASQYTDNPLKLRRSAAASSGTTGMPLSFYHNKEDDYREWASLSYQWKRAGFDPVKSIRMEFRGEVTAKNRIAYYPDQRMIRVSVLHLTPPDIKRYAHAVKQEKVTHLHGFPSALALLADTILKENLFFPAPEGILLASEQVHPWQIEKIQSAFPTSKLTAHYGCAERTVMAGWCEHNQLYHVVPVYSLVEIDQTTSEIIGTNLFNSVNPFIRYQMTDTVGAMTTNRCADCGRSWHPLISQIGGRMEDYLFSEESGWIPPATITYGLKKLESISEMQFVQKEKRSLIFKYTSRTDKNQKSLAAEVEQVSNSLQNLMGASCKINTEQVERFERSRSGKFRWIVSELDESPTGDKSSTGKEE